MSYPYRLDPPIPVSSTTYFADIETPHLGLAILRYSHPQHGLGWLVFDEPAEILQAAQEDNVDEVLASVKMATASGKYAVGYSSYEAPAAWNRHIQTQSSTLPALIWFAVYESPPRFAKELDPIYADIPISDIRSELDGERWRERFHAVKEHLRLGDAYQVNLSYRIRFRLDSSGYDLFRNRCGVQAPRYSSYLCGDGWEVASLSPELFFVQQGDRVESIPMKGTVAESDGAEAAKGLRTDPKSMAENLMIVDMVRNDLGEFSKVGSVSVRKLFDIEKSRTVYQMTSTVASETDLDPADVLRHLSPAASVTGAPKIKACEIIRDLEASPRNVYCGAIGLMAPGRIARFNVAIRSAFLSEGLGEYGVGAGIVWDSQCEAEAAECASKAKILEVGAPQWVLRETLASGIGDTPLSDAALPFEILPQGGGQDGGSPKDRPSALRKSLHLSRLSNSMNELAIPGDGEQIIEEAFLVSQKEPAGKKIAVSVQRDGKWWVTSEASLVDGTVVHATFAADSISKHDLCHRHKTNSRASYEQYSDWETNSTDALLHNEDGFLTEFTKGSLIVQLDGHWITPDPRCGCLRSVYAQSLVAEGLAEYGLISLSDVKRADAVYFANAVVGMLPVKLAKTI